MEAVQDRQDAKQFRFTLQGSRTGPDGEGRSDRRFVSRSGRIVIEPEDWNVAFALMLAQVKPVPDRFTVTWSVVPHFVDEFASPGVKDATVESTVTLAQGLGGANTCWKSPAARIRRLPPFASMTRRARIEAASIVR